MKSRVNSATAEFPSSWEAFTPQYALKKSSSTLIQSSSEKQRTHGLKFSTTYRRTNGLKNFIVWKLFLTLKDHGSLAMISLKTGTMYIHIFRLHAGALTIANSVALLGRQVTKSEKSCPNRSSRRLLPFWH